MEKQYKRLGKGYARVWEIFTQLLPYLSQYENSRILDLGTGWGKLAIFLGLHQFSVITGEPRNFTKGKWRMRSQQAHVTNQLLYLHYRAEELPFRSNQFPVVVSYATFHFIDQKESAMREMYRVCIPTGWLIFIELIPKNVERLKKVNPQHPGFADPEYFRPWKELPKYSFHQSRYFGRIYQKS